MKKFEKYIKKIFVLIIMVCLNTNLYSQTNPNDIVHEERINDSLLVPTRIAIDAFDNIYVADYYQKCIVKYDVSGNFSEKFNTPFKPLSIEVNNFNQIFVGTKDDGNIYKIETNGTISTFYSGCTMPSSMTFSPSGDLYIVDSEQQKVIVLDVSGNLIQTFGLGDLLFPSSIAYDSGNSRILIGEHGGIGTGFSPTCKVWIYDLSGNLTGSFGSNGSSDGRFYRIQGVTIGKCGNIYVNEPFQSMISIFDEDLNFITRFGSIGKELGQFNVPLDVSFDSQDRLIVTSMNNSSVEIFNIIDSLPTASITNSDTAICIGDSADIVISFDGTPPFNFVYELDDLEQLSITTSDNPYMLRVSDPGLYEITELTDANYTGTCFTGSAIIEVSNIIPTSDILVGDTSICNGVSVDIPINFTGVGPWTFTYTIDGSNPTTVATTNNPHILSTSDNGLYEIVQLIGAGCTGTSNGYADVVIYDIPNSTISSDNLNICDGNTTNIEFNFTGIAPYTFTYTTNNIDTTIITTNDNPYVLSASSSAVYTVLDINDSLCLNTTNIDSIELIVNTLPTATMESIVDTICENETALLGIDFSGVAPWTLTYSDGTSSNTITDIYDNPYSLQVSDEGSYSITQLADANCESADFTGNSEIIVMPLPVSDFTYTQNGLELSFINNSFNANAYFWDFGDLETSTLENPIHTYQTNNVYQVLLIASNDYCGDSLFNQTIDLLVELEDINSDNLIKILPNPSNGFVTIKYDNPKALDIKLEIYSINGDIIYSKEINTTSISEDIDLSSYSSGIYNVKIISNEFNKTVKLVLYN